MKLQAANLCVECDELHDKQQCPSCGSTASYPIARSIRPRDERVERAVQMATEIAIDQAAEVAP